MNRLTKEIPSSLRPKMDLLGLEVYQTGSGVSYTRHLYRNGVEVFAIKTGGPPFYKNVLRYIENEQQR